MASPAELSRRTALSALAAGAVGYALWPIRPRTREDIPAGRKVLTYWEKWTGDEGAAMQRVVDEFNAQQDRLWVSRVPVSNIVPKALVAIGGGDGPDVLGLYDFYVPQFASAGAVVPLDDVVRAADYAPAVWRLLTHRGRPFAAVTTCHTLALYYNRRAFLDAGLDPDTPPRTIAELDEANERLERRDDRGRLARAGLMPSVPGWWPYFWPVMFGGTLYDPASNRATLTAARNVAAFEWIGAYPRRLGVETARRFVASFARSIHSAQDPFMAGRVAMIVQGPWLAAFIARYAPGLDYGCAPAPVTADVREPAAPVGLLEADVLMIPRGSRDREGAAEFIRFVQQRRIQEQLAVEHGKPSPLAEVSPGFGAHHPNPYVHVHDAIVRSPKVSTAPRVRAWRQYSHLIADAFDAIWDGEEVLPELDAAQARAQELLDLARRREALT